MVSVSRTGPAGYEHQYRVSVLLGLRADPSVDQLHIERVGEEDATLRQSTGAGFPRTLEIQIKSTTNRLGAKEVAKILLAFPRGRAEDCLLSRLSSDSSRVCLIFSGGSTADSVAALEADLTQLALRSPNSPLPRADAATLEVALQSVSHPSKTSLGQRRKKNGGALVRELGLAGLRRISQRIYIFPRCTSEKVVREIAEVLASEFIVPREAANKLADEPLRKVIEAARDSGEDCVPALHRKAKENSADRISPRLPYVSLGGEEDFDERLRDDRYVLLAGLPLCGKTQLAKALASRLQRQGVHARVFDTVPEAARFLLEPASGESRAAVIEDPFGKVQLSPDARESWSRLSELIDELPPARRLLVTTRSDILALLRGSTLSSNWAVSGRPWHIVDRHHSDSHLVDVWNAWAQAQGRDVDEQNDLRSRLARSPILSSLEPGHAAFLALRRDKDYTALSDAEIASLARRECEELSRELLSLGQDVATLLRALAASCSTLQGPAEATLAFIAEDNTDDRPGRRPESFSEELEELPRCDPTRSLNESSLHALELMEQRGVVERNGAKYRFAHPLWEEAGRRSLSGQTLSVARQRRLVLSKALFAGDVASGENAIAALTWLCESDTSHASVRDEALSMLEDASECVFPRVSDVAMSVLLRNLEHLPISRRKRAVKLATTANYSSRQLRWSGTVAWLPSKGDGYEMGREFERLSLLREAVPTFRSRTPKDLSPSELLTVIEGSDDSGSKTAKFLEYALHADESTIRASAAIALAQRYQGARPDLVDRALSDPHPAVVCSAMVGLALSWHSVSEKNRNRWLRRLIERISSIGFGLAALHSLTSFRQWNGWSTEWYSAKNAPWRFWARCAQAALSSDPGYFGINDARLHDLARQGMQHLHPREVVAFCEAWQSWVERRLRHGYPSDYAASAGEALLANTTWRAAGRRSLIRRLSDQKDTTVQCILIRDLLLKWRSLSPAERALVCDSVLADRADSEWLVSAALIDGLTPTFLLRKLELPTDLFSLAPDQAFRAIPPDRCHHVLSLFCGYPGVLYATGIHHLNEEYWMPVLCEALYDSCHPSFPVAVRELVLRACDDTDLIPHWERLCRCGDEDTVQALFEALFLDATQWSNSSKGVLWWLIVRSPRAAVTAWSARVVSEIEAIDYADNAEMVLPHFPGVEASLAPRFAVYGLVKAARRAREAGVEGHPVDVSGLRATARCIFEHIRPRGFHIVQLLVDFVWPDRDDRATDPDYKEAEEIRQNELHQGSERQSALREPDSDPIDWVSVEKAPSDESGV